MATLLFVRAINWEPTECCWWNHGAFICWDTYELKWIIRVKWNNIERAPKHDKWKKQIRVKYNDYIKVRKSLWNTNAQTMSKMEYTDALQTAGRGIQLVGNLNSILFEIKKIMLEWLI